MTYLQELAENAHLVLSFAKRDIRAKYKQTILGVAWAVIQPLSLMVVFTLVFSLFARVPSEGVPYPIFSYSVLIFWVFFASCVSQGTVAMTANATLVRKIYFPRETLLLAVMLSAFVDLTIAGALLAAMFVYYHVAVSWAILWVIPLLALEMLITLAVILITSAVQVYYRDVGHALPLLLQLWMFASPIAYPLSSVPERLKSIYLVNPMAGIIDGYRSALLHGTAPNLAYLGTAAVVLPIVVSGAYLFFKRVERTFADVI